MWIFFSLTWSDQVTPWKSIYDRDPQNHIWMNHLDLDTPSRIWLKLFMTWTHQVTSEIMNYGLHNHMWDPPSQDFKKIFDRGPKNHIWMIFDGFDPPSHTFEKYLWQGPQKIRSEWIFNDLGPTKPHRTETMYDLDPPSHIWNNELRPPQSYVRPTKSHPFKKSLTGAQKSYLNVF